ALDFLSIPSTSCDCERAFSGSSRTLRWRAVASELNNLADYIHACATLSLTLTA
ncbi:hypothetical protein BCR34DRAFT_570144, partial [Clohesyomyces aquaticus]